MSALPKDEPMTIDTQAEKLDDSDNEPKTKDAQAEKLINLAEDCECFHTAERQAFITVPVHEHDDVYPSKDVPVKFRRTRGMRALAKPAEDGSIQSLRDLVNVTSESEWRMLVAWLVMAFN